MTRIEWTRVGPRRQRVTIDRRSEAEQAADQLGLKSLARTLNGQANCEWMVQQNASAVYSCQRGIVLSGMFGGLFGSIGI